MIRGTTLTPEDLYRAARIYGPDLLMVRGATRRSAAPSINSDSVPRVLVPSGIVMHIDLFFKHGIPFLLSVVTPFLPFERRVSEGEIRFTRLGGSLGIYQSTEDFRVRRESIAV